MANIRIHTSPPPDRIRAARKARGWSQMDLARYLGASEPSVRQWELGYRPVTVRIFRRLLWELIETKPASDKSSSTADNAP